MRGIFSIAVLLIVLGVVAISARNQLKATADARRAEAPAAASASSAPFEGSSSPSVAQFQRELDKTMRQASDRAASAGGADAP